MAPEAPWRASHAIEAACWLSLQGRIMGSSEKRTCEIGAANRGSVSLFFRKYKIAGAFRESQWLYLPGNIIARPEMCRLSESSIQSTSMACRRGNNQSLMS